MKPHYQDNHINLYCGDARNMAELKNESVQCVVTSPPYWGLRKYSGVPDLIWGGKDDCEHRWVGGVKKWHGDRGEKAKLERKEVFDDTFQVEGTPSAFCSLCGAWKGSYGLEPTPEMYIEHTIEFLHEIRRVLRKDGVVFWNIGDSYNSKEPSNGRTFRRDRAEVMPGITRGKCLLSGFALGLKPKDLCLIPFRIAIAAQEDGWWVRSVIIWSKPNPMPESVTDRPTESHEYILMLIKSARYYWDADAVRREYKQSSIDRVDGSQVTTSNPDRPVGFRRELASGANLRSVWEFPTQPYPEAHFAVFPEKLPETCIKAATPEVGCCSKCGAPWERVVKHIKTTSEGQPPPDTPQMGVKNVARQKGSEKHYPVRYEIASKTIGWQPTCKCNADKVPSIVLDPFGGAGTTPWVAKKLGRRCYVYELSREYCELIVERNRQQVLM